MIIYVMGIYYAPYMFIFVSSALYSIDPEPGRGGHMSGLSRRQVMTSVTLPLVAPAVLSGVLLTFVAAAGQFGVPALLGFQIRYYVLTTYMYQLLNQFPSKYNLAASLGFIMLAVACIGVWLQSRAAARPSYATLTGKGFRPRQIRSVRARWGAFSLRRVLHSAWRGAAAPDARLGVSGSLLRRDILAFDVLSLAALPGDCCRRGTSPMRAIGNTLFLGDDGRRHRHHVSR